MNYEQMLKKIRIRLNEIDQLSLENDSYNKEWLELSKIEDGLIKLIKIEMER
mgnify:CR=1 FL=1